jgi:GT2 family glycosyltransferase
MVNVTAIILNWNRAKDTIECLETLREQENVSLDYVVVDNHSTDNSVREIRNQFPQVKIIESDRNYGYPGGMNIGIRYAMNQGAQKILLLNNDTLAHKEMVHFLLAHMTDHIGVTAPAIFYANDRGKIWSIGGNIHPLFLELINPQRGKHVTLPKTPKECDFLTGCAMLVSAEVFHTVGLFDEQFFPGYYEDMDYCYRIRKYGYHMLIVPEAHLWHKVSQSSGGELSPRVYYLMGRNSGYYFRKHMQKWQAPFILTYRFLSAIKTSVKVLIEQRLDCLIAYWRGLFRGWLGLFPEVDQEYITYYQ